MVLLEVACFTPASAVIAARAGADRIELCDNQAAGGTTPPFSWLTQVKAEVAVPVFVMIRPRAGNFMYSDSEFDEMKESIRLMKSLADGFVLGILDAEGRKVDVPRATELVSLAQPLPCTFHRAFDEVSDMLMALDDVIATGCTSILSSGGAPRADEGVAMLRALIQRAQGRLVIMPGGGVRTSNLRRILEETEAHAVHSSGLTGGDVLVDAQEVRRMKQLLQAWESR